MNIEHNCDHLKDFNPSQFLVFCNEHDGIVTEFGKSIKCNRQSSHCEHQCKKHSLQKNHPYIGAQKLLVALRNIKTEYKLFHRKFINEEIAEFGRRIKEMMDDFLSSLRNSFREETLLTHIFCSPVSQALKKLLSQDPKEWNLSNLTCKDVNNIISFHERLQKEKRKQKVSENNLKYLKTNFMKALIKHKIFDKDELQHKKKPNIEAVTKIQSKTMEECLNLIDIKLEELKEQMRAHEAYHVEELVIKIDEKFLDPTSSEVEERKMYEINEFHVRVTEFMKLARIKNMHIFVRVPVYSCFFWEKIRTFVHDFKKLHNCTVYTTEKYDEEKFFDRIALIRKTNTNFKIEELEEDQFQNEFALY